MVKKLKALIIDAIILIAIASLSPARYLFTGLAVTFAIMACVSGKDLFKLVHRETDFSDPAIRCNVIFTEFALVGARLADLISGLGYVVLVQLSHVS